MKKETIIYKIGDKFRQSNGERLIIASITKETAKTQKAAIINIATGNLFGNPITIKKRGAITQAEIKKMSDESDFAKLFKKV